MIRCTSIGNRDITLTIKITRIRNQNTYKTTLRVIRRLGDRKASKKAIYKILTMQTTFKENSPSTHNDFVSLLLGDEYHIVSCRVVSYRIVRFAWKWGAMLSTGHQNAMPWGVRTDE